MDPKPKRSTGEEKRQTVRKCESSLEMGNTVSLYMYIYIHTYTYINTDYNGVRLFTSPTQAHRGQVLDWNSKIISVREQ